LVRRLIDQGALALEGEQVTVRDRNLFQKLAELA